jgi:hypothetical protein
MDNSAKLQKKLREKSARRKKNENTSLPTGLPEIPDSMEFMMENLNKMLKTNPQMVQQISKCVSSVMGNKELMESLTQQFQPHVQTNPSNSAVESLDALSNESKQ